MLSTNVLDLLEQLDDTNESIEIYLEYLLGNFDDLRTIEENIETLIEE